MSEKAKIVAIPPIKNESRVQITSGTSKLETNLPQKKLNIIHAITKNTVWVTWVKHPGMFLLRHGRLNSTDSKPEIKKTTPSPMLSAIVNGSIGDFQNIGPPITSIIIEMTNVTHEYFLIGSPAIKKIANPNAKFANSGTASMRRNNPTENIFCLPL